MLAIFFFLFVSRLLQESLAVVSLFPDCSWFRNYTKQDIEYSARALHPGTISYQHSNFFTCSSFHWWFYL